MNQLDPQDFIITKKRKKYRFALFKNNPLCFEFEEWNRLTNIDYLEIGAGTALFSMALAERYPAKQFLAVDVKADRLQKGALEAEERGLKNIQFLRARADQLDQCILPNSLEKIWITFPDPFPRDRSAKHRLTHPKFLSIYKELLSQHGELLFKTDAKPLFEWSLEQLVDNTWRINELSFHLHESDLSNEYKIPTTYETRFVKEGLTINFVNTSPCRSVPPSQS